MAERGSDAAVPGKPEIVAGTGVKSAHASTSCVHALAVLQGWQDLDRFPRLPLGNPQLVKALQIQPKLRARAEEMTNPYGFVAGNGALPVQNLRNAISRDL